MMQKCKILVKGTWPHRPNLPVYVYVDKHASISTCLLLFPHEIIKHSLLFCSIINRVGQMPVLQMDWVRMKVRVRTIISLLLQMDQTYGHEATHVLFTFQLWQSMLVWLRPYDSLYKTDTSDCKFWLDKSCCKRVIYTDLYCTFYPLYF